MWPNPMNPMKHSAICMSKQALKSFLEFARVQNQLDSCEKLFQVVSQKHLSPKQYFIALYI